MRQDFGSLGMRLKAVRALRDFSQADVSRLSGIALRTIQHYEMDNYGPSAYALKVLCQTLSVRADWLLGLDEGCGPNLESLSFPLPCQRR
jgi:transcriptional regulator with XRE-family HTH domain